MLSISLLAAVTACGDKSAKQASNGPAREIQLAPSAPAQPQLTDTAATAASAPTKATPPAPTKVAPPARAPRPVQSAEQQVVVRKLNPQDNQPSASPAAAPVAAAPAPAPSAPPVAPMGTLAAGTAFAVHPVARVCTNTFKPGERFTATLDGPVSGSNGLVIPSGSSVVMRVDEAIRSNNGNDSLKLTLGVVSLRVGQQSYDVTGHVTQTAPLERVRVQSTGDQAKKIGAGAVIGALAGQLLGHNTRSTVIGGAVGAAAGTAVAAGTADYDGCVPANGSLMVNLDAPLRVRILP